MSSLVHWANNTPPQAPYYAVVFSSQKHSPRPGYAEMDDATMRVAAGMPGYLGHQVVHNGDRTLFVSYWRDMTGIEAWRKNDLHSAAKQQGKAAWYDAYHVEICRVENTMTFER